MEVTTTAVQHQGITSIARHLHHRATITTTIIIAVVERS
jgi:hypothetical protein